MTEDEFRMGKSSEAVAHPAHYGGSEPLSRKGRPRIDLSGERFGMLVAEERVRDLRTGYANLWRCRCDCGGLKHVFTSHLRRGKQKSCGCRPRSGSDNGRWLGGRRTTRYGYVLVHSPEHPAANSNGYVREHRLAMEVKLGRYLRANEVVHHKNGVRSDNSIGNLELWVKSHPKGQRVSDLVEWARSILKEYGDVNT